MKYKIRYLPLAIGDLDDIAEYLSKFYKNTLKKTMQKMEKEISMLSDFPYKNEVYEGNSFYRKLSLGNYNVFYHVNETNQSVDIHRVLRSSWNLQKYV